MGLVVIRYKVFGNDTGEHVCTAIVLSLIGIDV